MNLLDENTIRLECRYDRNRDIPPRTVTCSAVTYQEPEYSTRTGANGTILRTMIVEAALLAVGLSPDFDRSWKGDWTHVVCSQLPNGEAQLLSILPMDGDGARFMVLPGG